MKHSFFYIVARIAVAYIALVVLYFTIMFFIPASALIRIDMAVAKDSKLGEPVPPRGLSLRNSH